MRKILLGNNGREGPLGWTNSQEWSAQDVIQEAWESRLGGTGRRAGHSARAKSQGSWNARLRRVGHFQQVGRTQIQPSVGEGWELLLRAG